MADIIEIGGDHEGDDRSVGGTGAVGVLEQLLRDVDIFRGLSVEQRSQVANIGRMARWRQGERLGVEGQVGDALWVLLSGQVELTIASALGHLRVRLAGPGESLPLAALVGDGTMITTVNVLSDIEAVEIPRAMFVDLCASRPDIGSAVYEAMAAILAERYRATLHRLANTLGRAVEQSGLWPNV